MKKRGQLLAQPFVMIFGIIVGALILTWGIYEVYKLINVSCDVELVDYVTTLKKDVQRYYYYESGSSNRFKVDLPCEASHICFVSQDIPFYCRVQGAGIPCVKPQGYNQGFIVARKNDNVFIYSKKGVDAYYVPYLRPTSTENPLCISDQKQIVLTSKGTYVEVSNV